MKLSYARDLKPLVAAFNKTNTPKIEVEQVLCENNTSSNALYHYPVCYAGEMLYDGKILAAAVACVKGIIAAGKTAAEGYAEIIKREVGAASGHVPPEPFKSAQEQIDFLEGEIEMFKREREEDRQNILNLKERMAKINEISSGPIWKPL